MCTSSGCNVSSPENIRFSFKYKESILWFDNKQLHNPRVFENIEEFQMMNIKSIKCFTKQ